MFKFYKMMFLLTLFAGSIISISSHSWMGMWLGLEINLLSFIPLMNSLKNMFSAEASIKYFITQAIASTILLFALISMANSMILNIYLNNSMIMIFNSTLLMKMGAAPFHFWFPEVMEGLNWINCLIILTWQKIAPMILIMFNFKNIQFFSMIIIISLLIGGIMGLNQISLRKIMAYSSINHIAWMISAMIFMETIWLFYFCIYTIISLNLIVMFSSLNIFYLKQLFNTFTKTLTMKFFFIMNFLSLGGLPPFLGFFSKWLTIQMLISNNFILMTFFMMMLTLITLFYYLRISFSGLIVNMSKNLNLENINNFNLIFSLNFVSLLGLLFCTVAFNFL